MTSIFFVRHAKPNYLEKDDRNRLLTKEGEADSLKVKEVLAKLGIDVFISSPYKRAIQTISTAADSAGMKIIIDERLRERSSGPDGGTEEMLLKRWQDFDFCEQGGETLGDLQKRNIEAVSGIIKDYKNKNIVVATHGAALGAILNYFIKTYDCTDFLKILWYMPYIIRLDFEADKYVGMEEILIIDKKLDESL